jgi:glucosamine--fructose-6-phosphate aminotransferase (isomerizing)
MVIKMCGIFGLFIESKSGIDVNELKVMSSCLLKYSESRGKEATGISFKCGDHIDILKSPHPAKYFIKSVEYKKFFYELEEKRLIKNDPLVVIGHSRLATNGTQQKELNNQPVQSKDLVCVHNGIIVNHQELTERFPQIERLSELDTEVFLKLINMFLDEGDTLKASTQKAFEKIEGTASVALFNKRSKEAIVVTNTGSLYYRFSDALGLFIFASEKRFLDLLFSKVNNLNKRREFFAPITHLEPGTGINLSFKGRDLFEVSLSVPGKTKQKRTIFSQQNIHIRQQREENLPLKRCTKCILPHTMPFIDFNDKYVCNYCLEHENIVKKPMDELFKTIDRYRKRDGSPDCIVAFSGGRDSSYGLHLIKKKLGLNPIAVTYDWGVVTDLARRNQSRMCATLGVEHVVVSADIERKRQNIKKNLEAWLRRPELGMIPIFMAGDKHFFYYAQKVARDNNIELIIFCVNPLEKTDFKFGFTGSKQKKHTIFYQGVSFGKKLSLASYYLKNFFLEPKYLNSSLVDTAAAYFISYFMKHPYTELFDYFNWDEDQINSTLINEYGWEVDPTTTTTWRIGDGTAAFYNYIYYHVVGFTENDTFRSNQIREKIITREQAMLLAEVENQPRYEAIRSYLNLLNVDYETVMKVIDMLPRRY